MSEPERVSNATRATAERQLVALVRELMIEYTMLNGQPPSLGWLLKTLGER